ncbi:MAG: hypothetical protein JWM86_1141, partial [Thermoleophilia bacterium]|nr:hypothetical protein [Thermoleophilia bacterium]
MTPQAPTPITPFDEYLATCSGAAGTALDAGELDFEGRRFLGSTSRDLPIDPVRAYAGTRHGDPRERAARLVRELVRLGAARRSRLVLAAPTGRGWANHVLLRALEHLSGGDVSTACSQFGSERSTRSRGQLAASARSLLLLVDAVEAEPALRDVELFVVGESFGAWTMSTMLPDLRVADGLLFAATPGVARLDARSGELAALDAASTRVVRLERPDDPVVAVPGA